MFKFQDSLPRLPVPELSDTLAKYLKYLKIVLNEDDYNRSEKIVQEFGKPDGQGEYLTNKLKERAKTHDNWLAEYWLRYVYLGCRQPVIHSYGPINIYQQQIQSLDHQLRIAAYHAYLTLAYNQMVQTGQLPVDKFANIPLCMMQYKHIFSANRTPGKEFDISELHSFREQQPPHIIVAYKNKFFCFDVLKNGDFASKEEIYHQLNKIVHQCTEEGEGIGILSATNRDCWHKCYSQLIQDEKNAKNLEQIAASIFLLAIDCHSSPATIQQEYQTKEEADITHGINSVFTGYGSNYNTCNRWFDKRMQIFVDKEGIVGVLGEHSDIDGTAIVSYCEYIAREFAKGLPDITKCETEEDFPPIKEFQWNLTDELKTEIQKTKEEVDKVINNFVMSVIKYTEFGKEFIKSCKMSPDSFFQTIIQLTYYKLHGKFVSQYESASTRMFYYGRTETVRSTTAEVIEFIKAYLSDQVSREEKQKYLRKAIEVHKRLVMQASMGKGWDRHMFGMKISAIENGLPVPEIFNDIGYITSSDFTLSTSQIPFVSDLSMACFAPVTEDGYGVFYNIKSNFIFISVTSFRDCDQTSTARFCTELRRTLTDVKELLSA